MACCRDAQTWRRAAGEFHVRGAMLDDNPVEIPKLLQPGVTKASVDHAARASWLAAVHDAMRAVGRAVTAAADELAVGRIYRD